MIISLLFWGKMKLLVDETPGEGIYNNRVLFGGSLFRQQIVQKSIIKVIYLLEKNSLNGDNPVCYDIKRHKNTSKGSNCYKHHTSRSKSQTDYRNGKFRRKKVYRILKEISGIRSSFTGLGFKDIHGPVPGKLTV